MDYLTPVEHPSSSKKLALLLPLLIGSFLLGGCNTVGEFMLDFFDAMNEPPERNEWNENNFECSYENMGGSQTTLNFMEYAINVVDIYEWEQSETSGGFLERLGEDAITASYRETYINISKDECSNLYTRMKASTGLMSTLIDREKRQVRSIFDDLESRERLFPSAKRWFVEKVEEAE
jgi:hypothetical protein